MLYVFHLYLSRYQKDREGRTALDWAERFGSAQLADVMRYDPKRVSSPASSDASLRVVHVQ
jgi:hypothetical protein